ncbi:MAG TPA: DUF4173 domain-containing protein [Actinomycetota bacterium]|nr:DUF4173 domain-containing protein [Actinomycetota bacterium]
MQASAISGKDPQSEAPAVAPPLYLVAVTITGIAGAAWLVDRPLGVGVVLVASLAAFALLAGGFTPRGWSIVFGALGVALVSTAALRAALWVVFPNLAFALILAAFAVRPPASWSDVLKSLLGPAIRSFSTPAYLFRSAGALVHGLKTKTLAPLTRGLVIGGALVAVFWALFASADRAFLEFSKRLIPDWDLGLWPFWVATFVFVVAVTTAFHLAGRLPFPGFLQAMIDQVQTGGGWRPRKVEWVTALTLLNLLFLAFVTVQALVLFAGHDHILRTANLSYAEYAREGFFQLLVSGTLTIAVVAVSWNRAERANGNDLTVIRGLLGVLCLMAFVVLVSAIRRLSLYEEAFGFTRLRLSAHALGLWVGGVLILLLIGGATLRTRWLARTTVILTACALLLFSGMNPEGMIAGRNLARFKETGKIDLPYLSGLSGDAVPELARLPAPMKTAALAGIEQELSRGEPWSSFNLGRERARGLLSIP